MSSSFKRIPVKDMPPETFRRQVGLVVLFGLVLIAAAAALSFWVNTATDARDAQQRGVHVQMAASRIGQQFAGTDRAFYQIGKNDGTLTDAAEKQILSDAHEQGTVRVTGFDQTAMQATALTYDDGSYTVTYNAQASPTWTVASHRAPFLTHTY
jgi:hypothetical protein